jgi:hypothetical protein
LGYVARVFGVRGWPKPRLASDDPAGQVFAEGLAGDRSSDAFLALGVELPDNLGSCPAADIDALLAAIRKVEEN